ncbi:MAG: hypothetical protein Q8J68_09840 [Methanolobus sp.]|uniref:hypothetical protein n=1 Tax=Methanolobus sp. TaxID=1874737 RepID=UPI002731CA96|nr:hypothetical protein [Methanolobus sp.]MDP2217573.1 hypothetical protein [Methanolobus sp.]
MNRISGLIVFIMIVVLAFSGCLSSSTDDEAARPAAESELEVVADPTFDTEIPVFEEPIPEEINIDIAADYYNPNVYSHIVIEDSAFERVHGGDVSGYMREYAHEGGTRFTIVSTNLFTEHPDFLGTLFYYRADLSPVVLSGLLKSDVGREFSEQYFRPTSGTLEFYRDLNDLDMIEATAQATLAVKDPYTGPRYNYGALTLHGSSGEKHVIMMPYFSNLAADYVQADQTGGLTSEIYEINKEFSLNRGLPESYFKIAERNLGL